MTRQDQIDARNLERIRIATERIADLLDLLVQDVDRIADHSAELIARSAPDEDDPGIAVAAQRISRPEAPSE